MLAQPNDADVDDLSKFLDNHLLGGGPKAKTFVLYENFKVTNILTHMEKLQSTYNFPMLEMYEGLSEHSHPNAAAMMLLYTDNIDGGVAQFTDRNEERGRVSMLLVMTALLTSLQLLNMANEMRAHMSDDLATLVELKIHKRGNWPNDLEFPIKHARSESI